MLNMETTPDRDFTSGHDRLVNPIHVRITDRSVLIAKFSQLSAFLFFSFFSKTAVKGMRRPWAVICSHQVNLKRLIH